MANTAAGLFLKKFLPINAAAESRKIKGTKKYAPYPRNPSKNEFTAIPTSPKISERVTRIKNASAENNAPTAPILSFVTSAFSLFFFLPAVFSSVFFSALPFSSFKTTPPKLYTLYIITFFLRLIKDFKAEFPIFFLYATTITNKFSYSFHEVPVFRLFECITFKTTIFRQRKNTPFFNGMFHLY